MTERISYHPESSQLLQPPLKKDSIDYLADATMHSNERLALGLEAVIPGLGLYALHPDSALELALPASMLLASAAGMGRDTIRKKGAERLAKVYEQEAVIKDEALGWHAQPYVYQGKPEEIGGIPFKKGDNFFFVTLPSVVAQDGTPISTEQSVQLWGQIQEVAIDTLQKTLVGKNYKAICFTIPQIETNQSFSHFGQKAAVAQGPFFAGKNARLQHPDRPVVLLTKEEFESINKSPHELFGQLLEAFSDPKASELARILRTADSQDARNKARELLRTHIQGVLTTELMANFGDQEVLFEHPNKNMLPKTHRRVRKQILKTTIANVVNVQTIKDTGEVTTIPIDKALQIENIPVEQILATPSQYRKARIAVLLSEMLSQYQLDSLDHEAPLTADNVKAKLQTLGLKTNREAPVDMKFASIANSKAWEYPLGILILGAFSYTALQYSQHKELFEQPSSLEPATHRTAFPNNVPPHKVEWNIQEFGIAANGYYTVSTSHEITPNARWVTNEAVEKPVNLPLSFDPNQPHLVAEKRLAVNMFGATSIRIPIKDGTTLGYLTILDQHGKNVPFLARELTDGTVRVDVVRGVTDVQWIDIQAYLTESEKSQIHAAGRVAPLKRAKLSSRTNNLITSSIGEELPEWTFENGVARRLSHGHKYSINPHDRKILDGAKTPEEVLNATVALSAESCDVAAAGTTIAASFDEKHNTAKAQGWLNLPGHPASSNGLLTLTADEFHSFVVSSDNNGENTQIIDPTPFEPAKDAMTKKFMAQLHDEKTATQGRTDDAAWKKEQEKVKRDMQERENIINQAKLLGVLVVGGSGFFLTRQTAKFLPVVRAREQLKAVQRKVRKVKENFVLGTFDDTDLRLAYNFFTHLSFGQDKAFRKDGGGMEGKSKQEILAALQSGIDYEKVTVFLKTPQDTTEGEDANGLTREQRNMIRILGNQLLS